MKLIIDAAKQTLIKEIEEEETLLDLYSREAFACLSRLWLKLAWNQKYTYTFSWMGRPVIQLPEDMIRTQEVIYHLKPDVIIETGVAHGGSLIYYAGLCKAMGNGRVIGIDIEIRPHNRKAIEAHELFPLITLVEGSSTDTVVINQVKSMIKPDDGVLVLLDSNHSQEHVSNELQAYYKLIKPGFYLVVTDGIMKEVHDTPRGRPEWAWDNPLAAVEEFLREHPEFVIEQPPWPFNESDLKENITHWPQAWLKRR